MWFFMNTCYLCSFLSFVMLLIAFAQSFVHFKVINADGLTFIVLTSIIYLFTETLVIFFFVGTGVSVKEYSIANKLDPIFHLKSIALKRRIYPPLMLNLLLMIILFITYGAVDTRHLPAWVYQIYFMICFIQYIDAKIIQHKCFRENTENVLAMSGLKLQG